jgi:hypothetical protein
VDGFAHPLLLVENTINAGADAAADPALERRPHLLIAGTGRAGTSFLVRFLAEAGLDTRLARAEDVDWDEDAQAGLEDLPASALRPDLPYVLKQPWSYEMVEEILADPGIELQAAIIPVRNLVDAVSSRVVVQLRAMHQEAPWMTGLRHTWRSWGSVPGGIVYSLDPVDQSRLLAVGFHHLIERLVQADVPIIFVAFPRLAEDADYLYARLRPLLPEAVTLDAARTAHRRIADAAKIRIEGELRDSAGGPRQPDRGGLPSFETLDNIALRRELDRLRERLAETERAARSAAARRTGVRRLLGALHRRVWFALARLQPRNSAT